MTAELVEAAGLEAKKMKGKNQKQGALMISPSHIVQAVSGSGTGPLYNVHCSV